MQDFLDVPFETEKEEASPAFELLPQDRYEAQIASAKAGPTKNGKGYAVTLNWSITKGDYENRTVFQSILIQHESAEAQKIGRQKFKDVLVALGINEDVTDLSVMLFKPCLIGVVVRKDDKEQYPDKNEVRRVMPLRASPNGPTREAINEAQKVQPAFKAVKDDMSDSIPF
jgi:hypothetical protein